MTTKKSYWFTIVFEGNIVDKIIEDYHALLINGNTEAEVKASSRTEARLKVKKYGGKILRIER